LVVVVAIGGVMWIAGGGGDVQSATSPRKRRITTPAAQSDVRGPRSGRAVPSGLRGVKPAAPSGPSFGLGQVAVSGGPQTGGWVRVRSGMLLLLVLTLVGVLVAVVLAAMVVAAALGLHSAVG